MEFSSQTTGVGSLSLLQGIFPTLGSNPGLLHCRRILYHSATREVPVVNSELVNFLLMMFLCCVLEKAVATHSSTLAWKIPWTEEPGSLQSMGSLRVGHD